MESDDPNPPPPGVMTLRIGRVFSGVLRAVPVEPVAEGLPSPVMPVIDLIIQAAPAAVAAVASTGVAQTGPNPSAGGPAGSPLRRGFFNPSPVRIYASSAAAAAVPVAVQYGQVAAVHQPTKIQGPAEPPGVGQGPVGTQPIENGGGGQMPQPSDAAVQRVAQAESGLPPAGNGLDRGLSQPSGFAHPGDHDGRVVAQDAAAQADEDDMNLFQLAREAARLQGALQQEQPQHMENVPVLVHPPPMPMVGDTAHPTDGGQQALFAEQSVGSLQSSDAGLAALDGDITEGRGSVSFGIGVTGHAGRVLHLECRKSPDPNLYCSCVNP